MVYRMNIFLFSKQPRQAGFTLIELLVAIAIIGILAAVLVVNLVGARDRARDASRKEGLNQLKSALRLYYNDTQYYPDSTTSKIDVGNGALAEGVAFTSDDASTMYMKALPEYEYWKVSDDAFLLRVVLQNASDESIADSYNKCCAGLEGTYGCAADLATSQTAKYYLACED
jgi:prepilin-type N-terminal cleavage/methylation domain-containing protein